MSVHKHMSPSNLVATQVDVEPSPPARLASLDAFRGFVILTMIFVNYCAGISGIPAWMKHAPADLDGYTFVDVVFPGFLFIVGVAIPFSLGKRLARGDASWRLLLRIVPRVMFLLFLGVVFVSLKNYSPEEAHLGKAAWSFLFYCCVLAIWNVYPTDTSAFQRRIYRSLRIAGIVVLAWLVWIFHQKTEQGTIVGLRPSWWGILGIIGWAYLVSSAAYLLTRGNLTALMGVLGFMVALYITSRHGGIPSFLEPIDRWVGIGELFGSHAAITMAGVLVGQLFAGEKGVLTDRRRRMIFVLFFGVGLYATGQLLRPLHKISKIHGTESYALVTAGECCLLFLMFHYVMDIRGWKRWAAFLIPVGVNPLVAYILPDIFNNVLRLGAQFGINLSHCFWWVHDGWGGVLNSAVMTALMLLLTTLLTRAKVVLRL